MPDSNEYRVIARNKFAAVMVIATSAVAVGVWTGLDHLAAYREHLEELAKSEPTEAAAILQQLVQTFALINGAVLLGFSTLVIWHGWRGWSTASVPPRGSWIIEGQRCWTGEPAIRVAKFSIAVGIMLAVLGVASSLILWSLGDGFAAPHVTSQ